MAKPLLKHSVLVTEPLHDAAITRLSTFFEVETRTGNSVPTQDELLGWLHGKAGVITDSRFVFDAHLVNRLPTLKAVCNLDAPHHNLDLQALTLAGIRATHTPEPGLSAEASAQRTWQAIEPLLARALPVAPEAGRYYSWTRRRLLGPSLRGTCLGILAESAFAKALGALAQAAQVTVCTERDSAMAAADVLVIQATGHGLSEADQAGMKSTACVYTLGDAAASPTLPSQSWALFRSNMAAENMVASLGFGRNSWHPPYWLNPEIACDSCC